MQTEIIGLVFGMPVTVISKCVSRRLPDQYYILAWIARYHTVSVYASFRLFKLSSLRHAGWLPDRKHGRLSPVPHLRPARAWQSADRVAQVSCPGAPYWRAGRRNAPQSRCPTAARRPVAGTPARRGGAALRLAASPAQNAVRP